jgi:hypothetical protein
VREEDLEYDKEYKEMFKDEEIEELVRKEEIKQKKNLKILKMLKKFSSVKNPMKTFIKDIVKGFLQFITIPKQGNTEVNVL